MVHDVDVIVGTDVLKHFKFYLDRGKFFYFLPRPVVIYRIRRFQKSNFQIRFDGEKRVTESRIGRKNQCYTIIPMFTRWMKLFSKNSSMK